VQITDRELSTGDVDGEIYFRSAGEVLDIAITSVLRAALVDM
jgi:hypothetical protein